MNKNEYDRVYYWEHHDKRAGRVRDYGRRMREEALSVLGGTCVVCGETDLRVLQIDHIKPIRTKSRGARNGFHKSIVDGLVDNLQVLCANCHARKTFEEKYMQ